jgi:small conductance mechanosensitive channel
METKTYIDRIVDFAWVYGPKLASAILLLLIGFWIIRRVTNLFNAFMKSRHVDDSLRPFLVSFIDILLKIGLLLVVAGQVGLETTSFIAVFSALAFSVGLALQGSLGNFASGILILLLRPYRVGDWVRVDERLGRVEEINIFNTIMVNEHGIRLIVPNGKMTEGIIENMVQNSVVSAEIKMIVDAGTSMAALREATVAAEARNPWRVEGKEPEVVITDISRDDMKVEIAWVTNGEHYSATLDYMFEALREEFEKHDIRMAQILRREEL